MSSSLKTHRLPSLFPALPGKGGVWADSAHGLSCSHIRLFSSFPDSETCYDCGVRKRQNNNLEGTKTDTPPNTPTPTPASFCLRLSWHPLLCRESLLSWWGQRGGQAYEKRSGCNPSQGGSGRRNLRCCGRPPHLICPAGGRCLCNRPSHPSWVAITRI